jgi:hypothetical protein
MLLMDCVENGRAAAARMAGFGEIRSDLSELWRLAVFGLSRASRRRFEERIRPPPASGCHYPARGNCGSLTVAGD